MMSAYRKQTHVVRLFLGQVVVPCGFLVVAALQEQLCATNSSVRLLGWNM